MYCSKCGKQINENNKFCENCGNQLDENMFNTESENIFNEPKNETHVLIRICNECGNKLNDIDNVCHKCGTPVNNENMKFIEYAEEIEDEKKEKQDEITNNIETIKKAADIVKILFTILAVICFFISFCCLVNIENDEFFVMLFLFFGITGAILLVISRFIEAFIKWKAYMLETNYGILKNTENKIDKL